MNGDSGRKRDALLSGIVVVDLTTYLSGPFCTAVLADQGADVIKVERAGEGDEVRSFRPLVNGSSAAFMNLNRNKRGITLDLKCGSDLASLKDLILKADVLVQNFRPGVTERLGIGAEAVCAMKPSIVYCSISGFGQNGPYASRGGFDLIAQGMSGLMSANRSPDNEPRRIPIPVSDLFSGLYAAQAITSALVERGRTGRGQAIDIALLDVALSLGIYEASAYLATGQLPSPSGGHRTLAPYQAFRASDGWMTVGATSQDLWGKFCSALNLESLLYDERFLSGAARAENQKELEVELGPTLLRRPRDEWLGMFEKLGIPSGPVNTYDEAFNDPQVQARGMSMRVEHPEAGEISILGMVPKFSGFKIQPRPSPLLGEHNQDIAAQFGLEGLRSRLLSHDQEDQCL